MGSVLEGMFIINTSPLSTHKNMCEYARFLLRRFVTPHFSNGSMEIHIVSGNALDSPKAFERKRRDETALLPSDHKHVSFSDVCAVPPKWRECLLCRFCKRSLVLFLGDSFLLNAVGCNVTRGLF